MRPLIERSSCKPRRSPLPALVLAASLAGCATNPEPGGEWHTRDGLATQPLPAAYFDREHPGDLELGVKAYANRDYISALHEFYPLAYRGDSSAQFHLGRMFAYGEGVPRDPAQARTWLLQSARLGNRDAQFTYAHLLWQGDYLPQDITEAITWYLMAANHEQAEAQFILAQAYAQGDQVPQDLALAFRWMQRAADNGFAAARHNLALMYQYGAGVEADMAAAHRWFEQAAAQDSPGTAYDFGRFHLIASSPYYDPERALYWFRIAALAAHPDANRQVAALEALVDRGGNSLVLFGGPLAAQGRGDLRLSIRGQGGVVLSEHDDGWYDSYDSRDIWPLSDRLFVGYVLANGRAAALQYRLPGANSPASLAEVRRLISERYGNPDYNGERVHLDDIYNEWHYRDTRILLSRGAEGSLFLSYYLEPAYAQMNQEQMQQNQSGVTSGKPLMRVY